MVHGSRYRVPLRRRREQKTDYQARKGFIVSGKPRLVARSSLKNTVAQITVAKPNGDEVLASAHTHELVKKYGWKGATGNIPAAYLTGLLCGLKAKKNGISDAILDLGLVSPTKGSKVFAAMSGVVDAGVAIPHNPEKIVKDRQVGYHIQDYAESLGAPEEYAPKFASSVAKGLNMQKFSEHFFEVRSAILTAFGMPTPKPEARTAKPKKPEPKKAEVKKPEAKPAPKPAMAEAKPQPKPEAAPAEVPETKKLDVIQAKVAEKAEAKAREAVEAKPKAVPASVPSKPEAVAEEKPKAKAAKPKAEKAEAKTKPTAKKTAPAKKKAAKAEDKTEEPEAKPKRTRKKAEAKEVSVKPTKKTGGKKA